MLSILEKIPGRHIAVVGDPILDEYHFGRVERVCPEAPVPVFIRESSDMRPGGAANVANQLRALGVHTAELCPARASVKTRYMAGSHMLLRVDNDVRYEPTEAEIAGVAAFIADIPGLDAVICSDYDHGWLSASMASQVIHQAHTRKKPVPVIVDPKKRLVRYLNCDLICPSEGEFEENEIGSFANVLWKRGAKGMRLTRRTPMGKLIGETDVPTVARKVFDVTGAGDTVVAVVAAATAVGASYLDAARLAAVAAGYVVGEVGTTVCPLEKLKELVNASS